MVDVIELFCKVDDFCQEFEREFKKRRLSRGEAKRNRSGKLSTSEIMTLIILFQHSCYRHFKGFYTQQVLGHMKSLFPNLVTYPRFVQLMPRVMLPGTGIFTFYSSEIDRYFVY